MSRSSSSVACRTTAGLTDTSSHRTQAGDLHAQGPTIRAEPTVAGLRAVPLPARPIRSCLA